MLDTSLLVALANLDDAHHADAKRRFADPGPAVVPNEVLVETIGVLSHRASRQDARRFQDWLLETPGVEAGHATDMPAALRLQQQHAGLSLPDACAIVLARALGCGLDTYDERQDEVMRAG